MAGAGVQAWLITVLHTVKGMALEAASSALTGYMAGSTIGVLVGGWFVDTYKQHVLPFAVDPHHRFGHADPDGGLGRWCQASSLSR